MKFPFTVGEKPIIVGILNITPDSFFDGGRYVLPEKALARALEMEKEGADIIDIGAISTRPGSFPADEEQETERLLPVLSLVVKEVSIPVSADTYRPGVARASLDSGASVINDVSGFYNEATARLIKEYSAGWILTHTGGRGVGAGEKAIYKEGVVASVQAFFDDAAQKALQSGISPSQICLDPGFGFSKDSSQNLSLLSFLGELDTHSCALMCALSRKRFISDYIRENNLGSVLAGTLDANMRAYRAGARLFRVHDVREHAEMFKEIRSK